MSLAPRKFSSEEYLAWEAEQPERHEYYRGEVFAMVGTTRRHVEICRNMVVSLDLALRGKPCRVYHNDVKVRVATVDAYYYPDVLVTCSPKDLTAEQVMTEPSLVVEVLSPTTASYDRGLKLAAYRQLPSLQQYVLIDPQALTIETYVRNPDQSWTLRDIARGAELPLPHLELRLTWADVFRYVDEQVA